MGDSREFKANNEHWALIIQYFELYPQLLTNKFENAAGDKSKNNKLWDDLVDHLNSLGYGKKTTAKWQLAIGRWKSKVKAKASVLRQEMEQTGGGPIKCPPLTDLEERLMSILGWKCVAGDSNQELGIDVPEKLPQNTESNNSIVSNRSIEQQKEIPPLHYIASSRIEMDEPKVSTSKSNGNKENIMRKQKIVRSTEKSKRYVILTHA